jgi:hypothetical protein
MGLNTRVSQSQDAVRTRFFGITFWEKKLRKYMQVRFRQNSFDCHAPSSLASLFISRLSRFNPIEAFGH